MRRGGGDGGHRYDTGRGALLVSLSLARSVVPSVLKSVEFWVFLLLHLTVFAAYRSGVLPDEVTEKIEDWGVDWEDIRVVTTMTTLFEVFYTNTCYTRYSDMYAITRSMLGDATNYAYLLRTFVSDKAPQHARLAVRYLMAGVKLHLHDVRGLHARSEFAEFRQLGLLTEAEVAMLLGNRQNDRPMIMMQWSLMVAREAAIHVGDKGAALTISAMVMKIRSQQQAVADLMRLPVPFQYFHLLCAMIVINLALWAYAMGLTASWFAPVVYVCCSSIFIGMMNLASQLSDPFGDDSVDFDVDGWIAEYCAMIVQITDCQYPGGLDGIQVCVAKEEALPQPSRIHLDDRDTALSGRGAAIAAGPRGRYGTVPSDPPSPMSSSNRSALMPPRTVAQADSALCTRHCA